MNETNQAAVVTNIHRQAGASTSLGTMGVVILVVAFFAFSVITLFPVYYQSWSINSILNSIEKDLEAKGGITAEAIYKGIKRNLEVNDIEYVKAQDFKIRKNNAGGFDVSVSYKKEQPFFGNLSFLAKFDKKTTMGGGKAGVP